MEHDIDKQILKLKEYIDESHFTVAITGAGISISAGGVSYGEMGSRGGAHLMSGDPGQMYQSLYQVFMKPAFEHGPTYAHKALAKLEEMGKLQGIITTNEDCIHTMAGSKNVAEIQGSFQINTCSQCGKRIFDYEIWNQGHMPTCPDCGGMMLPYNIYSHIGLWDPAADDARKWMRQAELILIIGTSGSYEFIYMGERRKDAKVVQINPISTHFDSISDLNIRREADPVFEELMKLEES